mmetsp:Transcript_57964/g.67648  ORF Transcript_57964/g.67648 Transcript_57964/m.67648 type:complete len:302 (+) Transcript_57964:88-993(+)
MYDPPLKYNGTKDLEKVTSVKLEFTLKTGELIKVSFSKYTDEVHEILLLLIREYKDKVKTYDLHNLLTDEQVFDMFRRCLGGDALDTWDGLITSKTKNKTNFDNAMLELVETLMGEDAGEEQLLYLRETKKPSELKVQSWIRRMKAINAYLPSLGETALTELELVRIITQRIPRAWRTQFKLSEGHKAKTSIAAQRKLCLIESEEKEKRDLKERGNRDLNDTRRPRGKNNQKKLDSDGFIFKNKCTRCKDDEHDWYDCPIYNEKSKAYKARKKLEEKSQDREHNYMSDYSDDREIEDRDDF